MAADVSLFPVITDELQEKMKFTTSDYIFYYVKEDEEIPLMYEPVDESSLVNKLNDDNGYWTPDDFNIGVKRRITLRNFECVFGKNGVVCRDAVLGIAVMWTSSDSKQRGVIPVGDLSAVQRQCILNLEHEFALAQLRGTVELSTIVYIKNAGTPDYEEDHLANEYGFVLGELDRFVLQLDGQGSMFPVYEVNEPGKPLWYIKCDWDDPTYDKFIDSVSININTAHKNYKFLDKSKPRIYDEQLMKEIMASAIVIIVTKLKEQESYWDVTTSGKDLANGSVSEAVYYFMDTLGLDFSSPEVLSLSVRKLFDPKTV